MRTKLHRIFLSDLHLDDPICNTFLRFDECLKIESERADEIYILGDLVEMWIGDDDESNLAGALKKVLRETSARCSVNLMHGNRDFLFGESFCRSAGVTLLEDPYKIDGHILLSHGDSLCTDDGEYQAARKIFRDPSWQNDILQKSLQEREMLGKALRAQSVEANANKSSNIMDVNLNAMDEFLKSHLADFLIHGHTHRPGHYSNRIVNGSWDTTGWLCRQEDDQFQLECFSLATHYGNENSGQLS